MTLTTYKSAMTDKDLVSLSNFCSTLAKAPYYTKLGPGGVLAIWLTAQELNLPPMMCLNGGLYTFDGKVTMSAQMMNLMIVNAGHKIDILELTDKVCRIRFTRSNRENASFEYVYSIEMAQQAGLLHKDNWKKNPRDMLFSRCLSGGARKYLPDALMNCYVFGEVEDKTFNDDHLINVVPAEAQKEISEVDPPLVAQISEIKDLISEEQCKILTDLLEKCSKEDAKDFGINLNNMGFATVNELSKKYYTSAKLKLEKLTKTNNQVS